ncbi:hypothetical protein, partial [Pseudarthrobacter scleromae]|uniref:hypothetical protein n=1 Tax=Pseudarthrobacter scleromae TaxID=158897 RepID=UPI003D0916FD
MLKASPKKLVALAAAVITAFGVGAPAATGALVPPTANPFYAIDHDMIDLPEGVMPWSPNWTPDGKSIVFNDYNSGHGWIVDAESSAATCITCDMGDAELIPGAFTY